MLTHQSACKWFGRNAMKVESDLSRRAFLARLTILGVGCAAANTLSLEEVAAARDTINAEDIAKDERLAEGNRSELLVDAVDQDDPLQALAQVLTPGERRRV